MLLILSLALAACGERAELPVPNAEAVRDHYDVPGRFEVHVSGNVAELTVDQPAQQLRRGGSLWAKVGPYVFLFSEETRDLFHSYPGLAGVRVVTRVAGGNEEVARALLPRTALSELQWRRAVNIAGTARRHGTSQVTRLEELVRWGEDHTEFEYSPRFVQAR